MTLNCPSSRSSKLNAKYGDKYDDRVNRSQIGNHPWAIVWHHDFSHWMALNRPRSRSQGLLIKYLECEDRYNVGLKRGQIENHQWAVDWPYVLLSWMILNWPTSRSSKLHVRYCENGDRWNYCVNWSRIGNHPCAIGWHHDDDDDDDDKGRKVWQLTTYCHWRPPDARPLRSEHFWGLGTPAT